MIRAILWDNDGVLVDTEGLYFQAGQEVMATQGVELTQEDFVEQSLQKGQSVFDLLPNQDAELIDQLRLQRNARYSALLRERVRVLDGVSGDAQDITRARAYGSGDGVAERSL